MTPSGLPYKRSTRHKIDLVIRPILASKLSYRIDPKETKKIQRLVDDLLAKGVIKENLSHFAMSALLVWNKDKGIRICVGCRAINKFTIKFTYFIPHLKDLLDELHGAIMFSKINIRSEYYHIRIYEGKATFKTKGGLCESCLLIWLICVVLSWGWWTRCLSPWLVGLW